MRRGFSPRPLFALYIYVCIGRKGRALQKVGQKVGTAAKGRPPKKWMRKNTHFFCILKKSSIFAAQLNYKAMNKDLIYLFAIIATGATLCGLMIESTTFAAIGATMYLIPIYVAILGNRYF